PSCSSRVSTRSDAFLETAGLPMSYSPTGTYIRTRTDSPGFTRHRSALLRSLHAYSATTISRTGRRSISRRPFSSLRRSDRICLASELGTQSENFRALVRGNVIPGHSSDAVRSRRTSEVSPGALLEILREKLSNSPAPKPLLVKASLRGPFTRLPANVQSR